MNRLASIKDGYKMWENRYPLNPPETFTQKLAAQHAKDLAKSFEQLAPNYVGYLLQRLERCEKVFEKMSTGNFHAPMELSQIEAYKAYTTSMLEFLRTEDEAIQP